MMVNDRDRSLEETFLDRLKEDVEEEDVESLLDDDDGSTGVVVEEEEAILFFCCFCCRTRRLLASIISTKLHFCRLLFHWLILRRIPREDKLFFFRI